TVDSQETRALQRIEVRAFGVLLGELLERIVAGLNEQQRVALEALRDNCCQPDVLARPGFEEITSLLQSSKLR
ncbi:MAG: protein kinase, partial [Pseudomonas sp.]